ncbi:uncharacterized protein EI97DRAFT_156392 [Westerdykella ornata]|uniref:Cell surface spherulin 4-like protein n=1 Tax=Westerdykella ornata TaxID=318751 RepID=A0A6A6JB48_WESOR|nr:uncharacterized protein EI97DRAFT_156392 [Westerdykella ornata]KAF2273403.1 hypothetical protein EI97DRAFT_156392 [Westerdykella ornata]
MAASVILPLYVYPSAGAWEPLREMASSYPHVHFTAIVNPHNGPGGGALPNEDYAQAIRALNSLNNVRTIGYVSTTWCSKTVESVLDEIALYDGWGQSDPSLAMGGIFFDETPTRYSPENISYLLTISHAVHDQHGLKDGFVVHNPGAVPEAQYFVDPTFKQAADLTIIFEDTYDHWTRNADALIKATESYDRSKLAAMLHTTPQLNTTDTEETLRRVLALGRSFWLTQTRDYTGIDTYFRVFMDSLNKLLS